jgi:hypothetical protein
MSGVDPYAYWCGRLAATLGYLCDDVEHDADHVAATLADAKETLDEFNGRYPTLKALGSSG